MSESTGIRNRLDEEHSGVVHCSSRVPDVTDVGDVVDAPLHADISRRRGVPLAANASEIPDHSDSKLMNNSRSPPPQLIDSS